MGSDGEPQYLDEHHQRISEFAADYLEEDERDEFTDTMLERLGYQRQTAWAPPDPQAGQGGQGGGGRKPLVKGRQQQRSAGGQRGRGSYFR